MYYYLAVALLAASPVGEELISIPAGWALGLPLWRVVAVSLAFNFLPVPLILGAIGHVEGHPWIRRFVNFFRREKTMKMAQKYGMWGVALLAPLTGVYAMAVAAWAVGIGKGKIMGYIFAGLVAYAAACAGLILSGVALAGTF
jgi:uncharacterized membrane protein